MTDRESMVLRPRLGEDPGPVRKAEAARARARATKEKGRLLRAVRRAATVRRLQTARHARDTARARAAAKGVGNTARRLGLGSGVSKIAGPAGIALMALEVANAVGSVGRRAGASVSGRLLGAMDQHDIYGALDEVATGAARGRGSIESSEDLLRIIDLEGGVNSQIAGLGAYFREKETAIAKGADLIEREPGFDHLESIVDKAIDGARTAAKDGADAMVSGIRSWLGKEPLVR
jgi:hypothetical protein